MKSKKRTRAFHRETAIRCFNLTWELLDKRYRSSQETRDMLNIAHTSRFHWEKAGTPVNTAVGDWQNLKGSILCWGFPTCPKVCKNLVLKLVRETMRYNAHCPRSDCTCLCCWKELSISEEAYQEIAKAILARLDIDAEDIGEPTPIRETERENNSSFAS